MSDDFLPTSDPLELEFAGKPEEARDARRQLRAEAADNPVPEQPEKPQPVPSTAPTVADGVIRITAPGIYSAIPMIAYLADPCVAPSLSSSILIRLLQRSPMHAWANHPKSPNPIARKANKGMNLGTVAHALILEKSEDNIVVVDPQDYPSRPKRKGEEGSIPKGWTNTAMRAVQEEILDEGKTPLLIEEMQTCRNMVEALQEYVSRSQIAGVFERGEAETTAVAQEGPVLLRCRPDFLTHERDVCIHLKTTARSAKPSAFGRGLLRSMGYDIALAFYARVIAGANGGNGPLQNVILVQEQEPPYACSLVSITDEYEALASRMVGTAIDTWAQCMKSGRWPGYSTRIEYIKQPPYLELDIEEEEVRTIIGGQLDSEQERHGLQI